MKKRKSYFECQKSKLQKVEKYHKDRRRTSEPWLTEPRLTAAASHNTISGCGWRRPTVDNQIGSERRTVLEHRSQIKIRLMMWKNIDFGLKSIIE